MSPKFYLDNEEKEREDWEWKKVIKKRKNIVQLWIGLKINEKGSTRQLLDNLYTML